MTDITKQNEADKTQVYLAGISLRDWFAGMALQGLLAMSADPNCPMPKPEDVASSAFDYADAMLEERANYES